MSQPLSIDNESVRRAITAVRSSSDQLRTTAPEYAELTEPVAGSIHAIYDVYHRWLLPTRSQLVEQDLLWLADAMSATLAQVDTADQAGGDRIAAIDQPNPSAGR